MAPKKQEKQGGLLLRVMLWDVLCSWEMLRSEAGRQQCSVHSRVGSMSVGLGDSHNYNCEIKNNYKIHVSTG